MKLDWHGLFAYDEKIVKKLINKGGIYMISVKLQNGKFKSIYVGKTKYLVDRLLKHLSSNGENECIKYKVENSTLRFRYCYVNNEEDRKNVEYTLYKKYTPECNEVEPDGRKIVINFPY